VGLIAHATQPEGEAGVETKAIERVPVAVS
jgi:hypothetical protein